MTELIGLSIDELKQVFASLGQPQYRAKQVMKWLVEGASFEDMSNLPTGLRQKLREAYGEGYLKTLQCLSSSDGSKKYLFELADKNTIESVYMPKDYGCSVCVSTQVGCACGCVFCASCKDGLVRNLSAGEMLAQVVAANRDNPGMKAYHVVLMGMGEPMHNLREVIKFMTILSEADGLGIGRRNITVSTCGIPDAISELAGCGFAATLSISLHAATQAQREQIMPIAAKYSIEGILDAADHYFEVTGRRVTYEYILIDGFNDSDWDIANLARLLRGKNCHVNVIPLNGGKGMSAPPKRRVYAFCEELERQGISATVRKSMGSDIEGACGQLRMRGLPRG